MPKISVERRIEQVTDGTAYKGYLKIADIKLEYDLMFSIPIPKLAEMSDPKSLGEIQRIFQITVKKSGADIKLTDHEWGFFYHMLVPFAEDFYHLPQTRDSNEGPIGNIMRGTNTFLPAGMVSCSVAVTSNADYDFKPDLCAMLNDPKFGCKLAA
jgi:hypothetical protein